MSGREGTNKMLITNKGFLSVYLLFLAIHCLTGCSKYLDEVTEPSALLQKDSEHDCIWENEVIVKTANCVEDGIVRYACSVCERERQQIIQKSPHKLITKWFREEPSCFQGGYRIVICSECGWVDEAACGSVEPLPHELVATELQHGNCIEETIIVYICKNCNEQIDYERHVEPDEHKWIWRKKAEWDANTYTFVEKNVLCCERCNAVLG